MKNRFLVKNLMVTLILCGSAFYSYGKNKMISNEGDDVNIYHSLSNNSCNIQSIDAERSFSETIQTFEFSVDGRIVDSIATDGDLNISSYLINEGIVSCTIYGIKNLSCARIRFFEQSKMIGAKTIYFAQDNDGNYHSSILSMDIARRAAGQKLDYTLSDSKQKTLFESSISPSSIGVTGSVSGTLRWTDAQGVTHPLIGARVKATISGSWWSQEICTDQIGSYSLEYNDIWYIGSGKPMIHVYSEGTDVGVQYDGSTYELFREFDGSSGDWSFSYTFSPITDGDMGKAMMIFQGAKNFADYAKKLNSGTALSFCMFRYPSAVDTRYKDGTVYIHNDLAETSSLVDSYASWDLIGHEYAHHIQNVLGINKSPGGNHFAYVNLMDYYYEKEGYDGDKAKEHGIKVSWNEALCTYLSIIAQSHFSQDLKSIEGVGDTKFTDFELEYDLNAYNQERSFGDADEIAIQRILYKLQSNETDEYDKFSLGEETLWNLITTNKPDAFYSFVNYMYVANYNKNDLALLLTRYNVISGDISIENNYLDKLPTFKWSTYMGSENCHYDYFDLYFESYKGEQILVKRNLEPDHSDYMCKVTLTSDEWKMVNSDSGACYKIYFVGWEMTSYRTGGYYSESFIFEKPTSFSSSKIQIKPNEWSFEGRYYFQNEIELDETHRYSTLSKGGLTISTDRLRCGYIEDSYVILSPRRENAGLAYFEMNFDKPVYSIVYSTCLWRYTEGLDVSAIIQIKDSSGNWSTIMDLLNDISLTARVNGIKRYAHYSDAGIYGLRFEARATAIGERNKGRLCIDDLVFCTNKDSSVNSFCVTDYAKTTY